MEKADAAKIRKACAEGRLPDALRALCERDGDNTADSLRMLAEFFAQESCGKCTPCREGTMRIAELMDKLAGGEGTRKELELIGTLAVYLQQTSLCPVGQSAGKAFQSACELFPETLDAMIREA